SAKINLASTCWERGHPCPHSARKRADSLTLYLNLETQRFFSFALTRSWRASVPALPALRCAQSSARGFERSCLTRERRDFSSSVRWRAARVRRVGTRFAGRWFRRAASSRSLRRQFILLRCWLRSSRHVTTTPEGRCLSLTPVSTLLTCWPP